MDNKTLRLMGKIIRSHRISNQMNQWDLAFYTDISSVYLGKLERGECMIPVRLLKNLAMSLGIRIDSILQSELQFFSEVQLEDDFNLILELPSPYMQRCVSMIEYILNDYRLL